MKKIKSQSQLEDFLADQLSWRRKELHDLKSVIIEKKKSKELKPLVKSAIVLAYSHWEGYVKDISNAYLSYISFREIPKNEVAENFLTLVVQNNLKNKKFEECILEISILFDETNKKCVIPTENIINTDSNLNFEVLNKIMSLIGLDHSFFVTKQQFLDKNLLGCRNAIAHGENRDVNADDYNEIFSFVLESMTQYKTLIENALSLKTYLKAKSQKHTSAVCKVKPN